MVLKAKPVEGESKERRRSLVRKPQKLMKGPK
jgi:hypothetical protein